MSRMSPTLSILSKLVLKNLGMFYMWRLCIAVALEPLFLSYFPGAPPSFWSGDGS